MKITKEIESTIRNLYKNKWLVSKIANRFKVSKSLIYYHLTDSHPPRKTISYKKPYQYSVIPQKSGSLYKEILKKQIKVEKIKEIKRLYEKTLSL